MVELLAAVAIALTRQPALTFECGPPPFPTDRDAGSTPTHIWMRPYVCRQAVNGEHYGLRVLAHEILHVRLPYRSEGWVREHDDWYAENVVRWKLRRIAEQEEVKSCPQHS